MLDKKEGICIYVTYKECLSHIVNIYHRLISHAH